MAKHFGRLIEGANGIGGEWGHMPLPWMKEGEWPGPRCWCGQHGCLETWVSGTGLRRDFAAASGRELTGEAIVQAAQAGDPQAAAAVDRYIDRLGRALAMVSDILDPDVFVFGGGVSNAPGLYERLSPIVEKYVFSDHWEAKLTPAKWGDSSGVRGAARLWSQAPLT